MAAEAEAAADERQKSLMPLDGCPTRTEGDREWWDVTQNASQMQHKVK